MRVGAKPKRIVTRFAEGDWVLPILGHPDRRRFRRGGKVIGFVDNERETYPIRVHWQGITEVKRYQDKELEFSQVRISLSAGVGRKYYS